MPPVEAGVAIYRAILHSRLNVIEGEHSGMPNDCSRWSGEVQGNLCRDLGSNNFLNDERGIEESLISCVQIASEIGKWP